MNADALKNRLKDIQYQFLKENTIIHSDEELVEIATGLLVGSMQYLPAEDVVDSEMPTSFMGCTLDWTPGQPNDKIVDVKKGSNIIEHNMGVQYGKIIDPNFVEISTATSLIQNINGLQLAPNTEYNTINTSEILWDASTEAYLINQSRPMDM